MLNTKILNNNLKFFKKYKYFNNFYFNTYINLSIKSGKSKCFKKKYIKNFLLFIKNKKFNTKNLLSFSINKILYNFLNSKVYNVIFSAIKNVRYINNKKKYKYNLSFSILLKKKRKYFFLKYMKYFFFKNDWKIGIDNLLNYNIIKKNNKSTITNVYKRIFKKIVLKK